MANHKKRPEDMFWKTAAAAGHPLTTAQREAKRAYEREYYRQNTDRRAKSSRLYMKHLKRYGLTKQDYAELMAIHGEVCAICYKPAEDSEIGQGRGKGILCVDHDHATGKIRGLLCHNCNKGIGNLQDSPELLRNAALYLERSQ